MGQYHLAAIAAVEADRDAHDVRVSIAGYGPEPKRVLVHAFIKRYRLAAAKGDRTLGELCVEALDEALRLPELVQFAIMKLGDPR